MIGIAKTNRNVKMCKKIEILLGHARLNKHFEIYQTLNYFNNRTYSGKCKTQYISFSVKSNWNIKSNHKLYDRHCKKAKRIFRYLSNIL